MSTLNVTEARSKLYALIDEAAETHEPITITGKRGNAVLLAEEDWRAHVSEVMRGTAPEHAYCTFRLFARLFADASVRLAVLTSDSCALLQTPEIIQQVSNKLGTTPPPSLSLTHPFRSIHTIH